MKHKNCPRYTITLSRKIWTLFTFVLLKANSPASLIVVCLGTYHLLFISPKNVTHGVNS